MILTQAAIFNKLIHQNNKPAKSSAPTDGQKALDKSIPIRGNTDRRIAYCNGEIVIFDKSDGNLYHGHVRTIEDLTENMIKTLVNDAKIATKKAKKVKIKDAARCPFCN